MADYADIPKILDAEMAIAALDKLVSGYREALAKGLSVGDDWTDPKVVYNAVAKLEEEASRVAAKYGMNPEYCKCLPTTIPKSAANMEELMERLENKFESDYMFWGEAGMLAPDGRVFEARQWHEEFDSVDLFTEFPPENDLMSSGMYIPNAKLGNGLDYLYGQGFIRLAQRIDPAEYSIGGDKSDVSLNLMLHYGAPAPTKEQIATVKRIVKNAKKVYKTNPTLFVDLAMIGDSAWPYNPIIDSKMLQFEQGKMDDIEKLLTHPMWFTTDKATIELREGKPDHIVCGCMPTWAKKYRGPEERAW